MLKRIEASVFERARHFVQTRRFRQLASETQLPEGCAVDLRTLQLLASVKAHLADDVDVLVDVGAHTGGFAAPGYQVLGAREIVCFEANTALRSALQGKLSGIPVDLRWVALSDRPGWLPFHVHRDPSMSSLLTSDQEVLQREFPEDASTTIEVQVEVSTLDVQLAEAMRAGRRFFLKLDTQGNELAVLRGGVEVLKLCTGVLTEFIFTTPYQGQSSLEDLTAFMARSGFRCAAALEIRRRPSHRISAVDFLFLPSRRAGAST